MSSMVLASFKTANLVEIFRDCFASIPAVVPVSKNFFNSLYLKLLIIVRSLLRAAHHINFDAQRATQKFNKQTKSAAVGQRFLFIRAPMDPATTCRVTEADSVRRGQAYPCCAYPC